MHGSRAISAEVQLLLPWLKSKQKALEIQVKTLRTGWGTLSQRGHSAKEGGTTLLPEDHCAEWFSATCRKYFLLYWFLVSLLLRMKREKKKQISRAHTSPPSAPATTYQENFGQSWSYHFSTTTRFSVDVLRVDPSGNGQDGFLKNNKISIIITILLCSWQTLLIVLV